jgi:hypothetical protein
MMQEFLLMGRHLQDWAHPEYVAILLPHDLGYAMSYKCMIVA